MHDVVAQPLSVVVVQADGAACAARHGTDFGREQAHAALTTIGTTARGALAETRHLVGVLRTTDDEGEVPHLAYAPTEGLADLHEVPREVGLAAYRIVQESDPFDGAIDVRAVGPSGGTGSPRPLRWPPTDGPTAQGVRPRTGRPHPLRASCHGSGEGGVAPQGCRWGLLGWWS